MILNSVFGAAMKHETEKGRAEAALHAVLARSAALSQCGVDDHETKLQVLSAIARFIVLCQNDPDYADPHYTRALELLTAVLEANPVLLIEHLRQILLTTNRAQEHALVLFNVLANVPDVAQQFEVRAHQPSSDTSLPLLVLSLRCDVAVRRWWRICEISVQSSIYTTASSTSTTRRCRSCCRACRACRSSK
jgi:hypothetical protein